MRRVRSTQNGSSIDAPGWPGRQPRTERRLGRVAVDAACCCYVRLEPRVASPREDTLRWGAWSYRRLD
jgi:hypothetical protein